MNIVPIMDVFLFTEQKFPSGKHVKDGNAEIFHDVVSLSCFVIISRWDSWQKLRVASSILSESNEFWGKCYSVKLK